MPTFPPPPAARSAPSRPRATPSRLYTFNTVVSEGKVVVECMPTDPDMPAIAVMDVPEHQWDDQRMAFRRVAPALPKRMLVLADMLTSKDYYNGAVYAGTNRPGEPECRRQDSAWLAYHRLDDGISVLLDKLSVSDNQHVIIDVVKHALDMLKTATAGTETAPGMPPAINNQSHNKAIAPPPPTRYTDTAIEAAITPNPTTPDTNMTTPAAATITSVIANALDRPTIAAMKQGADQGVSHASFDGLVRKVRGIIEARYPIAAMLPDELANALTTFAIAELTAEGGFLRGPLGDKAAAFINARALASLTMSAGLITEGIIAPVVAEFKAFAAQASAQTPADATE